jgi:hypothetical protein
MAIVILRKKGLPWFLSGLLLLGLFSACGKKTNPVAPVMVIPNSAEDVRYQVSGRSLAVIWTIPSQNTDGSPLTDLKGFRVRKGEWPAKTYCATCPDQFQDTLWVDLKGPELPGITVEPNQVRVTYDQLKADHVYLFQVLAVNKKEIPSEPSKTLKVAWALPLKPPIGVQVKNVEQGMEISWVPPSSLVDGSAAEGLAGYALYRRSPQKAWERVSEQPLESPGFLDKGLQEAMTYSYQVKAVRRINGNFLESEASEEKTALFQPPVSLPAIQEMVAVSLAAAVQIRWQAADSAAVKGYHVYRRAQGEKAPRRLTRDPLIEPMYEDRPVVPGRIYFYSISAVGAPPARTEGPRSKEIEIIFNP